MKWNVDIGEDGEKRIKVVFEPKTESVIFIGQYHQPKTNLWTDFVEEKVSMNFDLETLQTYLAVVSKKLDKRIAVFDDLSKSFKIIRNIEIQEDIE